MTKERDANRASEGALDAEALVRLKKAAEEAAWLVARGYAPDAVSAFVGEHQKLDDDEQQLLACNARLNAEVRHHIARELDPDDIGRRPLRIDAVNVLATVAAAAGGARMLVSSAGVVCDPSFDRGAAAGAAALESAIGPVVKQARALRPSAAQWLVDETFAGATDLADAITREAKAKKLKVDVQLVPSAVEKLSGAAYVVSSDIAILDSCATWFNLPAQVVEQLDGATLIRLE